MSNKLRIGLVIASVIWLIVFIGLWCQEKQMRVSKDVPSSPPLPAQPQVVCLKEHKVHIYGTYQVVNGRDLPIDLTAVDCLEWGPRP